MERKINPIYADPGDRSFNERISKLETASPWPNADVSFHWTNLDYPSPHTHLYWEFPVIIKGEIDNHVNSQAFIMKQNHGCLIRPDDLHYFYAHNCDQVIVLNFMIKKSYMDQLLMLYGSDLKDEIMSAQNLSVILSDAKVNRIIGESQYLQASKQISMDERFLRCKLLFNDLFIDFMSQHISLTAPRPEWLSNLLVLLSDTARSNESIKKEITKSTQYSYSRLISLFKEHMGCTIIDYITAKRIEHAIDLLKHSDYRIVEIASMAGYDSVSNFNHIFKKQLGVTPTQYRKQYEGINRQNEK